MFILFDVYTIIVVKNDMFTLRVKNARVLRRMLKEVKMRMMSPSIEDAIVGMVKFLFPDIAIKYYPIELTPIIGGDGSEERVKERNLSRRQTTV